jgi:GTPase SAR1 family protein
MNFLSKLPVAVSPVPPQTVRVLVIGDQNVGKTALSELIVTKKASRPSKSTAGCAVSVSLWQADDAASDGGGGGGGAASGAPLQLFDAFLASHAGAARQGTPGRGRDQQKFFVEIWDVSANPYYEQVGAPPRRIETRCSTRLPRFDPQAHGRARYSAYRSRLTTPPPAPRICTIAPPPPQLRRTLYKQVNGVILVYDCGDKGSLRRLAKWASEVTADGSFVAPLPDETAARWGFSGGWRGGACRDARQLGVVVSVLVAAADSNQLKDPPTPARPPPDHHRNIGGLPVPVLIVANKADRARGGAGAAASSLRLDSPLLSRICGGGASGSSGGGGGGAYTWLCDWARGLRGGSSARPVAGGMAASASGANLAELEGSIRSVSASAATGQLDWAAVSSFFTALWARRYQPGTRAAALFVQSVPSAGQLAALGGGIGAAPYLAAGPMDRRDARVDDEDRRVDDWV